MIADLAVLYVEDDPSSREIIHMLLTYDLAFGNVTIWEDSADFWERVQDLSPRPNLVLLDIHVNPHNGFEMLDMLRNLTEFQGVPMVAMTASVMNEEIQMLQGAGFDGAISKPIDQFTFPNIIERILNGEKIWQITG